MASPKQGCLAQSGILTTTLAGFLVIGQLLFIETDLFTRGKLGMSNITARVRKIVVEQLGVKDDEIANDSSFVDDLGADSLDTVELVMALEEEFETEIPDEDAEKITTIQQAIDYITAHVGEQSKS